MKLPSANTSLAERMALSISLRNSDSNSCATLRMFFSLSPPTLNWLSRFRSVKAPLSSGLLLLTLPSKPAESRESIAAVSLNHDQVGLQGAGLLERLQDGHQVGGRCAHLVHRPDDFIQGGTGAELEHRFGLFLGPHPRAWHHHGLATGKGFRLTDDGVFSDGHRAAAVSHGRRWHAHVLADDDGAGTGVDDDLGHRLADFDFEVFQNRQVIPPLIRIERRADADRAAVERLGDTGAEQVVDLVDDILRRGEVRTIEVEGQAVALIETAGHRALDRGATGDAPGRGHVDGDPRTIAAFGIEATNHQIALGDGVDIAVDTLERRHQQA